MNDPILVLCAGLPRSASTWAYNAVIKILGHDVPIQGFYQETLSDLLEIDLNGASRGVIKCHSPDSSLRALCRLYKIPVIMSIRDPRDCVASLMAQFDFTFEKAAYAVTKSADALLKLADLCDIVIIRYEEIGSLGLGDIQKIATKLNATISVHDLSSINQSLSSKSILTFINELTDKHYFDDRPAIEQFHAETHWHPNHLGDGRIGKYNDVLDSQQSAKIDYCTRDFRRRFSYADAQRVPLTRSTILALESSGLNYLEEGFSHPEEWGIWTDSERAKIFLPLAQPAKEFRLEINCNTGPAFRTSVSRRILNIKLNGTTTLSFDSDPDFSSHLVFVVTGNAKNCDYLELEFEFEHLLSPFEAGINQDKRKIGLGLKKIKLDY